MNRQFFVFAVFVLAVAHALPPQKIVGGTVAAPGEFPYQVSLKVNGYHGCGGSIISNRHILTAAHCVATINNINDLTVVTGTSSSYYGGESHKPSKITFHGGYTYTAEGPDDIAIISLASPIRFNSLQNKINLPSSPTPSGLMATLSGWGYESAAVRRTPDRLNKIQLQTITADECQQYSSARLYSGQICTYLTKGRGACQGDSGGPLAYNGELIGVVSYGIPCAVGAPDIFTSVYHYVPWIRRMMAQT